MNTNSNVNIHLLQLILSCSQAAYVGMGKISNPQTGKVEKNMDIAKVNIDMLAMLKDKTKGNLSKEEENMINDTLANLQLNFAEEKAKPAPKVKEEIKKEAPAEEDKSKQAEEKKDAPAEEDQSEQTEEKKEE